MGRRSMLSGGSGGTVAFQASGFRPSSTICSIPCDQFVVVTALWAAPEWSPRTAKRIGVDFDDVYLPLGLSKRARRSHACRMLDRPLHRTHVPGLESAIKRNAARCGGSLGFDVVVLACWVAAMERLRPAGRDCLLESRPVINYDGVQVAERSRSLKQEILIVMEHGGKR